MRVVAVVLVGACSFTPGNLTHRDDAGEDAPRDDAPRDVMVDASGCGAVAIAASGAHTCVARRDGSVVCWGKNGQAENAREINASDSCTIGMTDFACVKSPNVATISDTITGVGLGDQHSCAISATKAYCWGANDSGQFGSGQTGDSATPIEVVARAGATQIGGGNLHTCSLAGGDVSCSGTNADGALGDGTTTQRFTPVTALPNATALGVGYQNTCAIVGTAVFCWGNNATRQVDATGVSPRTSPLAVGVATATSVAVGFGHVCALLADKTLSCWGQNAEGQLGRNGTGIPQGPGAVTSVNNVLEIGAAVNHTCALKADREVACWGEGYGVSPVVLALPRPALHIAAGSYHDCAILDDGSVWCWGWNAYGQYGNGTAGGMANTPVQAAICP